MENKTTPHTTPEFIRQRRAIHHGLCAVLTEPEAAVALVVWTEHFSTSGSAFSGLNNFVRDVTSSFDKIELQRELLQAINRALLMTKQEDLRPAPPLMRLDDPGATAGRVPAATPVPVSAGGANDTPEFQTFQILLLALLGQIDQQSTLSGMNCRNFIKEIVSTLPWSEAQQEQLIKLVDTGNTVQTRAYHAGQLKALLGHLAAWMEDNLGATVSLSIIKKAVGDVEKTAASRQHSPRLFL